MREVNRALVRALGPMLRYARRGARAYRLKTRVTRAGASFSEKILSREQQHSSATKVSSWPGEE